MTESSGILKFDYFNDFQFHIITRTKKLECQPFERFVWTCERTFKEFKKRRKKMAQGAGGQCNRAMTGIVGNVYTEAEKHSTLAMLCLSTRLSRDFHRKSSSVFDPSSISLFSYFR